MGPFIVFTCLDICNWGLIILKRRRYDTDVGEENLTINFIIKLIFISD